MSISGIVCKFLPDLSLPSFESNIIGAPLSLYQDFFVAGSHVAETWIVLPRVFLKSRFSLENTDHIYAHREGLVLPFPHPRGGLRILP